LSLHVAYSIPFSYRNLQHEAPIFYHMSKGLNIIENKEII